MPLARITERNIPQRRFVKKRAARRIDAAQQLHERGEMPLPADVYDQSGVEEQLRQAQRLESIGTLAGGVAHDFNNILTVIMGACDLLQMELEGDAELAPLIRQIISSSEKAAKLTHSLLAFSRKQSINLATTDLSDVMHGMQEFLARLIGDNIIICLDKSHAPLKVCIDRGLIEQVIMNLVVNARDAMPKGGTIDMALGNIMHDGNIPVLSDCRPGHYAVISIADSGCGMDEAVRARIFEPFFTTKEAGRGTGLGLSMAYGIVKQHEGLIGVDSAPDNGSVFKVYLPIEQTQAYSAEMGHGKDCNYVNGRMMNSNSDSGEFCMPVDEQFDAAQEAGEPCN